MFAGVARGVELEPQELAYARGLALSQLRPLAPADFTSNRVAFDPRAAALGRQLFFDTRLSRDGKTACATCHQPDAAFSSDRIVADPQRGPRHAPTLYGVAWQDYFFWDGRADSLWSQALGPLTGPLEHGLDFPSLAKLVDRYYAKEYRALFGRGPATRTAVNVGKALAAFEMSIRPPETALDRRLAALPSLAGWPECEAEGLKVFVGKGQCVSCHNGPLLTDFFFHDNQVPDAGEGRFAGSEELLRSPFNCRGPYADHARGAKAACPQLDYMVVSNGLAKAFKTPSLRGVGLRAPYMHNGSLKTLEEVVAFYREARYRDSGEPDIIPLKISDAEAQALACFLRAL
jgi:cytochrome c peroxidase